MDYINEYNFPPKPASPSLLLDYNRPIRSPPPAYVPVLIKNEPEVIELNDSDDEDVKIEHVEIKTEADDDVQWLGIKLKEQSQNTDISPPKKRQRLLHPGLRRSTLERTGQPRDAEISSSTEDHRTASSSSVLYANSISMPVDSINNAGGEFAQIPITAGPNPVISSLGTTSMSSKVKDSTTEVLPGCSRSMKNNGGVLTDDDWDKNLTWDNADFNEPNVQSGSSNINHSFLQPLQRTNFHTGSESVAANTETKGRAFKVPCTPSQGNLSRMDNGREEIIYNDGKFLKRYALVEILPAADTQNSPQMVSHCVQTGASIVNGESVSKTVEDVTRPTVSQEKASSSSRSSKGNKSDLSSGKDKVERKESSASSSKNHKRDSDGHRHRSKDKDETHQRNRRESEQRTVPLTPLFKTSRELLQVIRTCRECPTSFSSRREAVDHHKKVHNTKYCPVCYRLLTLKGNAWKDHLTKHHALANEDFANCPICKKQFSFGGMYQHVSKQHLKPIEAETNFADIPPLLIRQPVVSIAELLTPQLIYGESAAYTTDDSRPGNSETSNKKSGHKLPSPPLSDGPSSTLTTLVTVSSEQQAEGSSSSSSPVSPSGLNSGLNAAQWEKLLQIYKKNQRPTGQELLEISEKIKANVGSVKDWFDYKQRKNKSRSGSKRRFGKDKST